MNKYQANPKTDVKVGLDRQANVAFVSPAADILARAEHLIPAKVLFEIKRIHELSPQGKVYVGQMVTWQRKKSGQIARDVMLIYP
jgi:hypothetical protein